MPVTLVDFALVGTGLVVSTFFPLFGLPNFFVVFFSFFCTADALVAIFLTGIFLAILLRRPIVGVFFTSLFFAALRTFFTSRSCFMLLIRGPFFPFFSKALPTVVFFL